MISTGSGEGGSRKITITNTGSKAVTFSLSLVAAGAQTYSAVVNYQVRY